MSPCGPYPVKLFPFVSINDLPETKEVGFDCYRDSPFLIADMIPTHIRPHLPVGISSSVINTLPPSLAYRDKIRLARSSFDSPEYTPSNKNHDEPKRTKRETANQKHGTDLV